MARPSEYNFDLCIEICELVANGQNIISALQSKENYPSWPTFRRWKRENEELRTLYINSVQDKAEALESEMDDYRSMLLAKEIDASTYNTLVQTLKWKMAKFYPKMFGDKIQQEHSGEVTTTVISLGSGIKPNETTS
jgi:hypothetical protein